MNTNETPTPESPEFDPISTPPPLPSPDLTTSSNPTAGKPPSMLKGWKNIIPMPDPNSPELQGPMTTGEKSVLKGFGMILGAILLILCLWFFARDFFILLVFCSITGGVAYAGIKAKKSKVLSIGSGLFLGLIVTGFLTGKKSSEDVSSSDSSEGNLFTVHSKWLDIDNETRRDLTKSKYKDATDLQKELESLLKTDNEVTAEMIGQAEIWRHGVDFIMKEIEDSGFKPGLENSNTAMSDVYAALQHMEFAWDWLGKMENARNPQDYSGYASSHATHMKLTRERLKYARQRMDQGAF